MISLIKSSSILGQPILAIYYPGEDVRQESDRFPLAFAVPLLILM